MLTNSRKDREPTDSCWYSDRTKQVREQKRNPRPSGYLPVMCVLCSHAGSWPYCAVPLLYQFNPDPKLLHRYTCWEISHKLVWSMCPLARSNLYYMSLPSHDLQHTNQRPQYDWCFEKDCTLTWIKSGSVKVGWLGRLQSQDFTAITDN